MKVDEGYKVGFFSGAKGIKERNVVKKEINDEKTSYERWKDQLRPK